MTLVGTWAGAPCTCRPVRPGGLSAVLPGAAASGATPERGRRGERGPAPLGARRRLSAQARSGSERRSGPYIIRGVWGRRGAERRWDRGGRAAASAAAVAQLVEGSGRRDR